MVPKQVVKTGKDFASLTLEECSLVYVNMLKNSDATWKSAGNLAAAGDYGRAISLSIISLEELVKALIIYFDSKHFRFRKVKGMQVMFKTHQIRYFIAYGMFVMAMCGEELLRFLKQLHGNPGELEKWVALMKDEQVLDKKLKGYAYRKLVLFKNELEWFSNVDLFRQDGFYCDFVEELKNPISITLEDFLYAKERLSKVHSLGKELIKAFEEGNETAQENLVRIRTDFENNDHYSKIAASLQFMKAAKMRPFEFLKMKIDFLGNPS